MAEGRTTKRTVKRQSRKGLVKVYSDTGETFDLMTARGMNDFMDTELNPLMKFDRSQEDGKLVVKFGPDFLRLVGNNLAFFEEVARAEGGSENFRPGDTEDGPSVASQMLQNVLNIRASLKSMGNNSAVETIKIAAYHAIFEATALAANYHSWTLINEETSIVGTQESRAGGIKGAAQKARNFVSRDREAAEAYLELKAKSKGRRSETVLIADLGKKFGLKKSAMRDAIKNGLGHLKKSSGDQGKPEK
jgi:hypothetical protein